MQGSRNGGMMDDKPAIEYHPYGTLTLNFDEGPIKLRRCRLGDLEFGKNLLEEIRSERADQRQTWVTEVAELQAVFVNLGEVTEDQREGLQTKVLRLNELGDLLNVERINVVHNWLSQVAERMGDSNPPPKDEWPLDMFDATVPNEVIDHWQRRPLASGRTLGQNRTLSEIGNSGPPVPVASSPPAPPLQ